MRALIFELDGTLVDTVYAHVFACQRALAEAGMDHKDDVSKQVIRESKRLKAFMSQGFPLLHNEHVPKGKTSNAVAASLV